MNRPAKQNLTTRAYEEIKAAITRNELKQGDYLSENGMAKQLGMSRTPVREAIRILASEGLLDVHNGVGIFVRYITTKEIRDIFEVRAMLECGAASSAIRHIADSEIAELGSQWDRLWDQFQAGEDVQAEISTCNDQLHSLLLERCENHLLKEIAQNIHLKVLRLQNISVGALGDTENTIQQHREIIACLRGRDAEGLVSRLRDHIRMSAKYIIDTRDFGAW